MLIELCRSQPNAADPGEGQRGTALRYGGETEGRSQRPHGGAPPPRVGPEKPPGPAPGPRGREGTALRGQSEKKRGPALRGRTEWSRDPMFFRGSATRAETNVFFGSAICGWVGGFYFFNADDLNNCMLRFGPVFRW